MNLTSLHTKRYRVIGGFFALVLCAQFLLPALIPHSRAGTLGKTMVRFDRMQQSTGSPDVFTSGTVCLAASSGAAGTEDTVKVTFPTGTTVSTTAADWATNTTSTNMAWPSGALAMPTPGGAGSVGSTTSSTASGQNVTWKISNITDTQTYCFNWTNTTTALKTNTSTGNNQQGTVTTQATGPSTIDSNTFQTATIAGDQITVTATVNQNFTFALSATADALGTLSTAAPVTSPSPRTITLNTNAANGWLVWAKDSAQGLNSSTRSYTIASNCSSGAGSNSTLTAGTEGYNLGVEQTQTGGTGSISIPAAFQRTSTSYKGGGLCSGNLQTITSSSGTANNAVLTLYNSASINGATAAASDYTDTETFVGAGMF